MIIKCPGLAKISIILTNNIVFQYILYFKVSQFNGQEGYLKHISCHGQYCPENCEKQKWAVWAYEGWDIDTSLHVECGEDRENIIVDQIKTDLIHDTLEIYFKISIHFNNSSCNVNFFIFSCDHTSSPVWDTNATSINTTAATKPGESFC